MKTSSLKTREQCKEARKEIAARLSLVPGLTKAERTKLYEQFREIGLREKNIVESSWPK